MIKFIVKCTVKGFEYLSFMLVKGIYFYLYLIDLLKLYLELTIIVYPFQLFCKIYLLVYSYFPLKKYLKDSILLDPYILK